MSAERKLLRRWRNQISQRLCRHGYNEPPPPIVIMSYFTHAPIVENLIEIEQLVIVVLFEQATRCGRMLRYAGYSGRRRDSQIVLGGPGGNRFSKDLSRQPTHDARGQRLALNSPKLVDRALRMHAHLERHQKRPHMPRRSEIPLPPLLAGFTASVARDIAVVEAGNSLESTTANQPPVSSRTYFGLTLLPVAQAQQHLRAAKAVFADLSAWPTFRAMQLPDSKAALQGQRGAVKFDFFHSRFQSRRNSYERNLGRKLHGVA